MSRSAPLPGTRTDKRRLFTQSRAYALAVRTVVHNDGICGRECGAQAPRQPALGQVARQHGHARNFGRACGSDGVGHDRWAGGENRVGVPVGECVLEGRSCLAAGEQRQGRPCRRQRAHLHAERLEFCGLIAGGVWSKRKDAAAGIHGGAHEAAA